MFRAVRLGLITRRAAPSTTLPTPFSSFSEAPPAKWREPAAVPAYDGWDTSIEGTFRARAEPSGWASAPPGQGYQGAPLPNARDGICDSALDLVGQTPMIRLSRLSRMLGLDPSVDLVAKCEFFSVGGSVKDRVGLRMVREAEKDGRIQKGDVLIEPTSGNTGIGLCLAAAVEGYKVIITMPQKMSSEKLNTMRALGAEILRTPTEAAWDDHDSHISLAADLAAQSPHAHVLDQYMNASNPLSHYDGTAEEILRQTRGQVDVVVLAAGTGGTVTGVAKKLKEVLPQVQVVAVDPVGSVLAVPDHLNDHKRLQSYQVEGIGYDFVPTVLDRGLIDSWQKVDDPEAFAMARAVIKHEGLLVGGSSGSCIAGAVAYIKSRPAGELAGKRVVVLCADSIRNYMSKFLDDAWMREHGFDIAAAGDVTNVKASPAAELLAKASKARLREVAAAEAAGLLTAAEAQAQAMAVVKRLGPPMGADRVSLSTP